MDSEGAGETTREWSEYRAYPELSNACNASRVRGSEFVLERASRPKASH